MITLNLITVILLTAWFIFIVIVSAIILSFNFNSIVIINHKRLVIVVEFIITAVLKFIINKLDVIIKIVFIFLYTNFWCFEF